MREEEWRDVYKKIREKERSKGERSSAASEEDKRQSRYWLRKADEKRHRKNTNDKQVKQ